MVEISMAFKNRDGTSHLYAGEKNYGTHFLKKYLQVLKFNFQLLFKGLVKLKLDEPRKFRGRFL